MPDHIDLLAAAEEGDAERVTQLLESNNTIDINGTMYGGNTSLHLAAAHGHQNVVEILYKRGANLFARNRNGESVLISALFSEKGKTLVNYLLDKGLKFDSPIHEAAYKGGLDAVIKCVNDAKISINTPDALGHTALHYAAANNQIEIARWLLQNYASISEKNIFGQSALLLAAANGHTAMLALLLQNGAKITEENNNHETALLFAAARGHTETVAHLLQCGTDINEEQKILGYTPLLAAAQHGHTETVACLLRRGADINKCDGRGDTPLLVAARHGQTKTVVCLLQHGADINKCGEAGNSPLLIATLYKQIETVACLLQNGADIIDKNHDGDTPFLYAAGSGHIDLVKLLLQHGADITDKNNNGDTPLLHAAEYGHIDLVKLLLQHGAKITEKDNAGDTPLLNAVRHGNIDLVILLLQNGSKITEKNNVGDTPLLNAAKHGNIDLVILLLQNGAKITEKNNAGDTPLLNVARLCRIELFAAGNSHFNLVKSLLQHGAKITEKNNNGDTPLLHAARNGNIDLVILLLQNGADITEKDNAGDTPLLNAVRNGNIDLVILLLQSGAKITEKNNVGDTPLLHAVRNGNFELVKLLLQRGAKITEKNNNGDTPLLNAARFCRTEMTAWLLQKGAKITEKNNVGDTPLLNAARNGNFELVKLLLQHGAKITEKNNNGDTPLLNVARLRLTELHAARFCRNEMIAWLLQNGAKITERNNDGLNIFDLGETQEIKFREFLLKIGAGINKKMRFNMLTGYSLKNCIVLGMEINGQPVTRETPGFQYAITNILELRQAITSIKQEDIFAIHKTVTDLLESDPNNKNLSDIKKTITSAYNLKFKCLAACASYRELLPINILPPDLQQELNLIPIETTQFSELPWAGKNGNLLHCLFNDNLSENEILKIVDYMAKHHKVNIHKEILINGDTLLHIAAKHNKSNLILALRKLNFNVNTENNTGETALHCALSSHRITAIRSLLLCGVDPNYRGTQDKNKCPLELCKGRVNAGNSPDKNIYKTIFLIFESYQFFKQCIALLKNPPSTLSRHFALIFENFGSALTKAAKSDIELTRMLLMNKLNNEKSDLTKEQKSKLVQFAQQNIKDDKLQHELALYNKQLSSNNIISSENKVFVKSTNPIQSSVRQ